MNMNQTMIVLPKGTELNNGRRKYKVEEVLGTGGFGITYKVSSTVMVENVPANIFFAMKEYCVRFQYLCLPLMLLAVISFFSLNVSAQDLSVRSMEILSNDATASMEDFQRQDLNGNYAGVVKVMLAVNGATFEGGGVLEQRKHMDGEYWVWLAKDSKRIKVHVPGYLPLELNFFNDYKLMIEPKRTYKLVLTLPAVGQAQQDDGMRYLAMTVEPKNATLTVNGQQHTTTNGEFAILLPKGTYDYEVSSPDCASQKGRVTLDDNASPLHVRLANSSATLKVTCSTEGARIYVNGQEKGTGSWTGSVSPGYYKVEARLAGHQSYSETVNLASNADRTLNIPALPALTGTLNVNYSPIGSDVYMDGKKVGVTPNIFRNVSVGAHKVEIRKDGYTTLSQSVTIDENKQTELYGSLTAVSTQTPANSNTAIASQTSKGTSQNKTFTVNGVSFTMIYVEGGTFIMGATSEQGNDADYRERPTHSVTLSSYYIGETEVTQELWLAVMGTTVQQQRDKANKDWKLYGEGSNYPMYYISWEECQEFVDCLNSLTHQQFKLPTEAQWEYAARGGNKSRGYKYSGSNNINDVAWYEDNSGQRNHLVKTKSPNELGLYDMSGNVWEWCSDWSEDYSSSSQTNPTGASSGSFRVRRGGGWVNRPRICRSSYRAYYGPSFREGNLGLRLAL